MRCAPQRDLRVGDVLALGQIADEVDKCLVGFSASGAKRGTVRRKS